MKRFHILLLLMLLTNLLMAATNLSVADFEREVLRLSNAERAKYGLPALKPDKGLANLARTHSQNMIVYNFFAHKDHQGMEVGDRKQKYYPELIVNSIGENLGKFHNPTKIFTPQELVNGWMESPLHKQNILDKSYTHLGVGLVFKGVHLYATQNFASPMVKLTSKLPKKLNAKKTYTFRFEYMAPRPQRELNCTLLYPDPNASYKISEDREMRGAQPIPITWIDQNTLEVTVPFSLGKGRYNLCFGFNGGYFPEGVVLVAK